MLRHWIHDMFDITITIIPVFCLIVCLEGLNIGMRYYFSTCVRYTGQG